MTQQRSLKRQNSMPLKTPEFWFRPENSTAPIQEALLSPFCSIYQFGHKTNLSITKTNSIAIPVICVGNVTVGGSGKTPVCLAINTLIKKHNLATNPFFLTRGYGGKDKGPRRIEDHDDAKTVGDEPLLLVKHSNTIISKDRYKGALLAHEYGANCIIMDDGLQNQMLKKDISFMVINGTMGFGNEKTLPAGPLRELLDYALNRIDAAIIIGDDERNIEKKLTGNLPVFEADIMPRPEKEIDNEQPYIAFCGLAYPQKFYDTLEKSKINVIETQSFPDHYLYNNNDLNQLKERAKNKKAKLITTEKDHVRLPDHIKNEIDTLPVKLLWRKENDILGFLKNRLETFGK